MSVELDLATTEQIFDELKARGLPAVLILLSEIRTAGDRGMECDLRSTMCPACTAKALAFSFGITKEMIENGEMQNGHCDDYLGFHGDEFNGNGN